MMIVKQISSEETRSLRHKILRPHQDYSQTLFSLDDHKDSFHAGVFLDGSLIGVASLFHESHKGEIAVGSWRIRGMAVDQDFQNQGVGQLALKFCLNYAFKHHAKEVWCNARTVAVGFYEKSGFIKTGDEFEIEGIGPHYVLIYKNNKD